MTSTLRRHIPLACLVLFALPQAHAEETPASPATLVRASTWSANAGAASQYVSRGFRQTWGKPALQAGVDVVHPDGWSAGTWVSNVSGRYIENGRLEWDIYGGYAGTAGPLGYSVMAIFYRYPGAVIASSGTKYDYAELSAGLSYRALYFKYNHTVTRGFFGIAQARGTGYLDAGANLVLADGYTLNLHAGEGRVAGAGNDAWNWRDLKVGLTRSLDGGWSLAGAYTRAFGATDAYDRYTTGVADAGGHIAYANPAAGTFVVTLGRSF